jgi:dTDP-4-amino-4,6-dideoxygalactose transaminase
VSQNIPLFKIYWDEQDIDSVASVIKRGMYWASGPEIKEFENKVADYIGVKFALAVNSGTSALHVALLAHGIKEGDEVIVPSFTFIATANAPLFVGAKPIFAEIEEETYGLDCRDVENKINKRTKAIIPVHYGGCPCHIRELTEIARKHKLVLIEDAAESLGATVDRKKVGSFGDSAILSFCAPKVITMGEGGMILTNSRDIYEKAKLIYNHGRVENADYFSSAEQMQYISLGYNFRMSTLTAALGLAQLAKLEEVINMRQKNANYMTQKLSGIDWLKTPSAPMNYSHVYQLYTLRMISREPHLRDRLKEHLNQLGIGAKIYFDPIHLSSFYRRRFGHKGGELPSTEKIASEVLTMPMYPTLTLDQIELIADEIRKFHRKERNG